MPPPGPSLKPPVTLKSGEIACPNCGTPNAPTRLFCVKCATQLRAEALPPKKPPFRLHRGMILPFVLSLVIGLGATIGGARLGAIVLARAPQGTPAPGSTPVTIPGTDGTTAGFELTPLDPKPVDQLPDNANVRLVDYEQPTPTEVNDPEYRPKWWSDSFPRVPAITQFDNGPLEKSNCVMAAGAMLAELAFGIVTTASRMRSLQSDQEGATSYGDLNAALQKGWGVSLLRGLLSATQFRALSYAGAGIVVSLNYGALPVATRYQKNFTGNHSVYVDGFTPEGPDGRPAYWVMDPIGHSWPGYKGGWWPADDVEAAALARNNGRINAAWAFAGGIVPDVHKILPPGAYPGATPHPTNPGETAGPVVTEGPGASGDPMPTGDVDVPADDPDIGDDQTEIPAWTTVDIQTNVYLVEPKPDGLACTVQPVPVTCPGGIIGVIGAGGANDPTAPPIAPITMLYADVIAPGTLQIYYSVPPDSTSQLWFFGGAGIPVLQTPTQEATLGGTNVSVSTISVSTAGTFNFFATSSGGGATGISTMGTLVVGSAS
jgi:hypothetical protein